MIPTQPIDNNSNSNSNSSNISKAIREEEANNFSKAEEEGLALVLEEVDLELLMRTRCLNSKEERNSCIDIYLYIVERG